MLKACDWGQTYKKLTSAKSLLTLEGNLKLYVPSVNQAMLSNFNLPTGIYMANLTKDYYQGPTCLSTIFSNLNHFLWSYLFSYYFTLNINLIWDWYFMHVFNEIWTYLPSFHVSNILHPSYLHPQIHIHYVSLQSPFSTAGMAMSVGPFSGTREM